MTFLGGGMGGPGGGGMRGGAPPRGPAGAAANDDVIFVTEREFEQEVIRSELPVLIEFTADWCAPCKQIAPDVAAFAREMQGKAKVVKVDIDKAPVLARELRVQSVPTFMVFAQQRIADVQVGAIRKKQMLAMVEPFLPRAEGAIKPIELAQLLKAGAVQAVDTRDAAAYGRAHIPGAMHMPLEELETRLAELHMMAERPVLYCRSGDKTKDVAGRLAEQGVPVAFLEGGLLGWEAEGLPVERP
jgi:thioredoxin 1/putative thioredoxin